MSQCDDIELKTDQEHSLACEEHTAMDIENLHISESQGDDQDSEHKEEHAPLEGFMQTLEQYPNVEAKLEYVIQFMEESLSQHGTPRFKSFWQARDVCLLLFKENISLTARTNLWAKYSELTKEARRLKALLDEQSSFAAEQIDLAIGALEKDLTQQEETPSQPASLELPIKCQTLDAHNAYYCTVQHELDLLNTQAARINALRKELIKTEMRVRKKNQFFQRLSAAGDRVFPRRKELIKEVSQRFSADIDAFIAAHFSSSRINESLFFLREEIKNLQSVAKLLTLNAHAFTYTRTRLSECWDKLKQFDKERKQMRAEQKAVYKQHSEAVLKKIEEFSQAFQSSSMSVADANSMLEDITHFMRSQELGRDEVNFLREQLTKARQPLQEKIKLEEQHREEQDRERVRHKQQKLEDLSNAVHKLLKDANHYDLHKLTQERDALLEKIQAAQILKTEKQLLERQLNPLRELIAEKKEQALLSLSADDRQSLQQLKELLQYRKERRQEVKEQLEALRKALGSSGLDFERAMEYNAQVNESKERLEKLNQGVLEVEKQIAALGKRI